MCHLKEREHVQSQDEPFQVVSYFCNTDVKGNKEKNVECQTVIRSLASQLARLQDLPIAQPAKDMHKEYEANKQMQPSDKSWWNLFNRLLELRKGAIVAIVVDALDEMSSASAAHEFIRRMGDVMKAHSHVFFLCSSREHILVNMIDCKFLEYQMKPADSEEDMKSFIDNEIAARQRMAVAKDSIFCMFFYFQ